MTEAELLQSVLDLARIFHWKTAHFRPAKTARGWRTPVSGDGKGFPDLVLVRPPRVLFVELKSAKGRLALEQNDWITMLYDCARAQEGDGGVEVYVWRPTDLDGEKPEIVEVLR